MRMPTISRLFVASMVGLGAIAFGFACDDTAPPPADLSPPPPDQAPVLMPSITAIAPQSGPTQGGTDVTITGVNFQQGATVKLGSLSASSPVVSADGKTITFKTPANLGKPGPVDVVVTNPDNNTASRTGGFTYAIDVTFAVGATQPFIANRGPRHVVAADLDVDGNLDLVVAYANNATVMSAKGTSVPGTITFGTTSSRGVNTYPFMVAVADMNADNKPDVLTVCQNSTAIGSLVSLLGNGTITVTAYTSNTTNVGTTGQRPQWAQIIDVSGDGKPDVLVNLNNTGNLNVAQLINTWTATAVSYSYSSTANLNSGTGSHAMAQGDFDKDGKSDLVVLDNTTGNNVKPYRNLGSANAPFMSAWAVAANSAGTAMNGVSGDFDKDGNLDLMVLNNQDAGAVTFLKGNGQGGFTPATVSNRFAVGTRPEHLVTADLDGDGVLDLVVANYGTSVATSNVSWLIGNGDGTFKTLKNMTAPNARFNSVAVADFDKDGLLDIVATDYRAAGTGGTEGNVVVFKGTGQ